MTLKIFPKNFQLDQLESLFANILVKETMDFIVDQVCLRKKLAPICTILLFKRLLLKLATEYKFTFLNCFYKQTDECTHSGQTIFTHHLKKYPSLMVTLPLKNFSFLHCCEALC